MAIGWLTILKSVPWSDVIANAPKVAEGAKKLWKAVGKRTVDVSASPEQSSLTPAPEQNDAAELASRVATLEAAVADLHSQMLASSELIKALAEQNSQLVARVELNRARTLRLAVALVLVVVTAIALAVSRSGA